MVDIEKVIAAMAAVDGVEADSTVIAMLKSDDPRFPGATQPRPMSYKNSPQVREEARQVHRLLMIIAEMGRRDRAG